MLVLELEGVRHEGIPLTYSQNRVQLLARDGRLIEFDPSDARNFRQTDQPFRSLTDTQIRGSLQRELGQAFEVSTTGHYVVAHPAGERDKWSPRFEEIYRSFCHYFRIRGFELEEPQFPLVAVVWGTESDFTQYALEQGTNVADGSVGYYWPVTNRISLFDMSRGDADDATWEENKATIIHETAHQVAFNTGIHNRFAPSPFWIVEGLGTHFESPGVWDPRNHPNDRERINRGRLADFRAALKGRESPGRLAELINSDQLFHRDPGTAYAESWALTFYLIETQPRDYARYLKLVAQNPSFTSYESNDRLTDFCDIFGTNLALFDAKFLRFMDKVE
jgi:hypothetical protein